MSDWKVLDHDDEFGITQYIQADEEGVTLKTVQDTDAILDQNARMRSAHGEVPKGDQTWGNHVARIPLIIWERFCKERPGLRAGQVSAEDNAWLLAKLNSREYTKLKTFDGAA
jgi:hypothetical protein